jgi:hypothetical protein
LQKVWQSARLLKKKKKVTKPAMRMKHVLADWKQRRNLKLAVAVEVVVELRKERQPVHPSAELPVVEPAVVLHLEEADN